MCVRNMGAVVFQGLLVEFPVGLVTCIRDFQRNMPRFWSCSLLCVGEKAPKASLVTSTIDISEKAVQWNVKPPNLVAVASNWQPTVCVIK